MESDAHRQGISIGSWPLGPPSDGSFYGEFAQTVERLGFHTLFHGDHLFAYNPNMEVLTLLAYWSGVTERIKLGSGVLLAPLRDPVATAKQLATLDLVSGGRLIVGIGVGGEIKQEWTAMEISPARRGARTDEYLEIMKQFWSGDPIDFKGEFRTVQGVTGSPAPLTPGGPPILIGGRTEASLRRALRYQGWYGYAMSPRRTAEMINKLHDLAGGDLPPGFRTSMSLFSLVGDSKEQARDDILSALQARYHQDFSAMIESMGAFGTSDDLREKVQAYHDAGIDDLVWGPHVGHEGMIEQAARLSETFGLADRVVAS